MDRGVTHYLEWRIRMMKAEIRDMKDDELYELLKALREELDRRRAEVWERYTGFKYTIKKRGVFNE